MSLNYKTIFEINLLHEYFLTRQDGTTVFENPAQQQRLAWLEQEFSDSNSPVNELIEFSFPEHLQDTYRALHLRILPTYSGCRVLARVTSTKLADGTTVFQPLVPFDKVKEIYILITRKNFDLDSITNARLQRSCPALYFFSNTASTAPKTFPFLTNPVPARDSATVYEQGELSLSGGVIQEYYNDEGTDKWDDVTGAGFANESDRLLLKPEFTYEFPDTSALTEAVFTLSDSNGTAVHQITKAKQSGLARKTLIDFTGHSIPFDRRGNRPLSEAVYDLLVEGNNGFRATHKVIFSESFATPGLWAVVAITTDLEGDPFSLLAGDGFLFRRKDAAGNLAPAPVFEIPVKSRLTYWRFIHKKGKELAVPPSLADYLRKDGKTLITKKPRSVSRSWFFLRKEGTTDTAYVPNPVAEDLAMTSDRKLVLQVLVPQSDLFPEVP